MRNVLDKDRENQYAHFMLGKFFPPPENRAVYKIMWKNALQPDRPQMTM